MGKSTIQGKNRLDKYYRFAKELGYRSRASFKLLQIESKYPILNSSRSILDLCAAPGGWMQVAVQKAPIGALVVGVDLAPIYAIGGAVAVQEDITTSKCRATVKKILSSKGFKAFDLVLHDGSPNIGGAWAQEATSQNSLVIDSVRIATELLAPKGNFVTKVFRSQDYNAVVYCIRKFFDRVEVYKPPASRSTSAEIYVIGLRYKAPAKIDPRMLDIKYLFEGAAEPHKVIDVLDGNKKQKRHRDGYEDGLTLIRKIRSASDFVWCDNPVEMLGTTTSISFKDSSSLPLKEHALTTEEVLALCDDLSVLGKQDFKHLLKWRMNIRKAISSIAKTSTKVGEENEGSDKEKDEEEEEEEEDEDEDQEEKLLDEMEELTQVVERKKKREKKREAKRLAKDKARKATGMQIDAMQDGYGDDELFSLGYIKGKDDLATVDDAIEDVEVSELGVSDDEDVNEVDDHGDSSDLDSDEERERYDEKLEKILDEAYERYVTTKDGSTKQRKRAKQAYDDELLQDTDNANAEDVPEPYDSDDDLAEQEANPLVVPIDKEADPTQEELRLRWFRDDIFLEAVEEGDLGKDDSDDDMAVDLPKDKVSAPKKTGKNLKSEAPKSPTKKATKIKAAKDSEEGKNESDDDVQGVVQEYKASLLNKTNKNLKDNSVKDTNKNKSGKMEDDLEVVPAPGNSSDSSSDDDSDYDTDTKAELRALGKKMLGRKRVREDMIDMAYHKRMFDDNPRDLPSWFYGDEMKHNKPPPIITKEERLAEKARFNDINARPAKKVAEAKARKKRAAMRTLEKVRKKANSIADQPDIHDRSKKRMIDQLYKKATPRKPGKEKVVAKKGVQVRPGKGKVLVDRRMKKDARQHGMNKKAKTEKAKGKGKGKGKSPGKASAGKNSSKFKR